MQGKCISGNKKHNRVIDTIPHTSIQAAIKQGNGKNKKSFWTFNIGFEEVKRFHWEHYGVNIHKSKWNDLIVDVYI